jgi:uncharacterized protein
MNAAADAVFQFKKMLKCLEQCMAKANAHADHKKFEINVLAESRLAPDMFNFVKQIQATCDIAKFTASHLTGQTPPKHEDNETTWAQLHSRINKVLSYLDGYTAGQFEGFEKKQVRPNWAQGKFIMGDKYLHEIAVPNFYFHMTVAYSILRHNGVELGKMDYLGTPSLQ